MCVDKELIAVVGCKRTFSILNVSLRVHFISTNISAFANWREIETNYDFV